MSISVKIASHFSGKIQIWLKSGQILAFEKIAPLEIQPNSGVISKLATKEEEYVMFWDQKPMLLLQSTAALLSNSGKKCCFSAVSTGPLLMVEVSAFTGDISTI